MYMLDTDICSYIIRERPVSVLEKFKHIDASNLCVSAVTQAELLYGIARSSSKKVNREIVDDFTSRLIVLDWNSAAAEEYGALRASLEAKGRPIGTMDLMIASHALSIGAAVVTNNTRHFSIVPKLKTINWV
jgi:tRNA(fMet)-specific endonuclease VapC